MVVVLSKASVESAWVRKELAIALTGELVQKQVKVLPIVIEKCTIPPSLIDKFYANFSDGYLSGLRRLLEALSPAIYGPKMPGSRRNAILEFSDLVKAGDVGAIRFWATEYFSVLAPYFGKRWSVCEGISSIRSQTAVRLTTWW